MIITQASRNTIACKLCFFRAVPWKTFGFPLGCERGSERSFSMEHPDLHDLLNNPRLSILLLCEAHDMTREKLAELAGLSTSQVSRLINATPDLKRSTIISIANVFGILRREN